tara:strand:- start:11 stop:691 length:681 start_codon:yes stop_codon:yes gene_type:complete
MRKFIKRKEKKHFRIRGIEVFIKDELTNKIDLKTCILSALRLVPNHLLTNLETIYFGKFEHLEKLDLEAMYMNSSIFMSNEIENEVDIIDDLVHEIAHSAEETYKEEIYFDGNLEKEFLLKRKLLWQKLKEKGFSVDLNLFLETEYNEELDKFLYKEIGYQTLSMFSSGLFYSPYGSTSLREYFANGFEAFFMKEDIPRLKKTSPILYKKVSNLSNLDNSEKVLFY